MRVRQESSINKAILFEWEQMANVQLAGKWFILPAGLGSCLIFDYNLASPAPPPPPRGGRGPTHTLAEPT